MSEFVRAHLARFDAAVAGLPGARLDWLSEARRAAVETFARGGLPDARVEGWKYTSLRALESTAWREDDATAATRAIDPSLLELPGVDAARMVFVNGVFRADLSVLDDAERAVLSIQPLSRVLEGGGDGLCHPLTRRYEEPASALASLNAALAREGAVIRVAAGATIARPVHLLDISVESEGPLAVHARHIVRLGAGASLNLIESQRAVGAPAHWHNRVLQIDLADGARVDHTRIQDAGEKTRLVARTEVVAEAGAQYDLRVAELGAELSRHDLVVDLRGAGAGTTVFGVAALRGRQHADLQLRVTHAARDTRSRVSWRGVADGRARAVLGGAIVVAEGADGADAALDNKNLLLSPHAEIDAKPVLEILADEVKAAHGATVGQLDERALFYLRSRGLPAAAARSLLTFAFCRGQIEGIADVALREFVANLISAHLPARSEAT